MHCGSYLETVLVKVAVNTNTQWSDWPQMIDTEMKQILLQKLSVYLQSSLHPFKVHNFKAEFP